MKPINDTQTIKLGQMLQQRSLQQVNNPIEGNPSLSFGDTMSQMIHQVNTDQIVAETKVTDVLQGKSDNIHEAMISMTEAKISFQLMLEIRNRLLDAYKDIEKMPM